MEPIRQLHDNFKSQSKLIIFCDGKILYDHDQKTYCFDAKDLNSLTTILLIYLLPGILIVMNIIILLTQTLKQMSLESLWIQQRLNSLISEQHCHFLTPQIFNLFQGLQFWSTGKLPISFVLLVVNRPFLI